MEHKKAVFTTAGLLFAVYLVATFLLLMYNTSSPAKWITRCFKYDVDNEYWSYPPVQGLNVTFGQDECPLWWKLSDACGCVDFGSGMPDGAYWLEWTYGGTTYHEDVNINCSQLEWHFTNYLPAKGEDAKGLNTRGFNPLVSLQTQKVSR